MAGRFAAAKRLAATTKRSAGGRAANDRLVARRLPADRTAPDARRNESDRLPTATECLADRPAASVRLAASQLRARPDPDETALREQNTLQPRAADGRPARAPLLRRTAIDRHSVANPVAATNRNSPGLLTAQPYSVTPGDRGRGGGLKKKKKKFRVGKKEGKRRTISGTAQKRQFGWAGRPPPEGKPVKFSREPSTARHYKRHKDNQHRPSYRPLVLRSASR